MTINYATLQNTLFPAGTSTPQTLRKSSDGILEAYGKEVPVDGASGYAIGCIFIHMDGVGDSVLYTNEGTATSADFNSIKNVSNAYGTAVGTGPSPAIWEGVPLLDIMLNPQLGFVYFDDFLGQIDVTNDDGWALDISAGSGTISPLTTDQGGVMQISSVGSTEDDSINAQLTNCSFLPAAGTKIYFEARVNMVNATEQFFIGLAEVDTTLLASGALDNVVCKCGFYHQHDDTDDKLSAVCSDDASEEIDADVVANVDNTYIKLGFIIDGVTKVTYYADGVEVASCVDTSDLPNEVMCLSLFAGCQAAAGVMHVDWIRIAQYKVADGGRA